MLGIQGSGFSRSNRKEVGVERVDGLEKTSPFRAAVVFRGTSPRAARRRGSYDILSFTENAPIRKDIVDTPR
jgi:hypothetical protein